MSAPSFESLVHVTGAVSRETFERLREFEKIFLKWNRNINLSAQSTEGELWRRHILDSAQLAGMELQGRHWLDLGSGGGFPGLVMAFLLAERGGSIELVESNRKKASFLQMVIGRFHLPASVIARRIADSRTHVRQPDIVTARALAPLSELFDLAAPWLTSGARAVFHKGRDYRQEIQESAHRWSFDLLERPSLTDPEGVILDVRNLRKKDEKNRVTT